MIHAPSVDDVIAVNDRVTAGAGGVLSRGAIESAVSRPFHTHGGCWLYPTVIGQAAALLEGVVAAHGFGDGNKRTAWITAKTFLIINGVAAVKVPAHVAADFVEGVTVHAYSGAQVGEWIAANLAPG